MMAVAVVGLLMGTVAASAAQAAPHWKVNGKLLKPGLSKVFLSKGGTFSIGDGVHTPYVQCKSSSAEGFLLGTEPGNAGETWGEYLILEGCGGRGYEKTCPAIQEGQKAGVIKSNVLVGKLRLEGTQPRIVYRSELGPFIPYFALEPTEPGICGGGYGGSVTGELESRLSPELGIESHYETETFPFSSLRWGSQWVAFAGSMSKSLTEPVGETFGVFEG